MFGDTAESPSNVAVALKGGTFREEKTQLEPA